MCIQKLYGTAPVCDQSDPLQGLFQVCEKLSGWRYQRKDPGAVRDR